MFEALFLGLLQGLTEFLPISSSAHLRLAGEFLPSASDPGATFTAITQIGTELAVLIYFRKDIARIAAAWISKVVIRKLASHFKVSQEAFNRPYVLKSIVVSPRLEQHGVQAV